MDKTQIKQISNQLEVAEGLIESTILELRANSVPEAYLGDYVNAVIQKIKLRRYSVAEGVAEVFEEQRAQSVDQEMGNAGMALAVLGVEAEKITDDASESLAAGIIVGTLSKTSKLLQGQTTFKNPALQQITSHAKSSFFGSLRTSGTGLNPAQSMFALHQSPTPQEVPALDPLQPQPATTLEVSSQPVSSTSEPAPKQQNGRKPTS
jgi:hypothetical protein